MSDWLLALIPQYGLILIFVATLASCLALPIPASLIMLSAGGFAASGEMELTQTAFAAFAGAIIGDISGFAIGRRGAKWLQRKGGRLSQAQELVRRRGALGVFLSRWLISPLGPYVNFAAGAAGLAWPKFVLPAFMGELLWVGLYVGLGYGFSGQVIEIARLLGNASGFLAALALTIGLGFWLRHTAHAGARNLQKTP